MTRGFDPTSEDLETMLADSDVDRYVAVIASPAYYSFTRGEGSVPREVKSTPTPVPIQFHRSTSAHVGAVIFPSSIPQFSKDLRA